MNTVGEGLFSAPGKIIVLKVIEVFEKINFSRDYDYGKRQL